MIVLKRLSVGLLLLFSFHTSFAQKRSNASKYQHTTLGEALRRIHFRKFLKHIHLNLSVGGGPSFYTSEIRDMMVLQRGDKMYIITGAGIAYQVDWYSDTYTKVNGFTREEDDIIDPDNNAVNFKGVGITIPFSISLHTEIKKKLRVGVGAKLNINTIQALKPSTNETDNIFKRYHPSQKTSYAIDYVGILGFKIVQNPLYSVLVDNHIGATLTYTSLYDKWAVYNNLAFLYSVGLTVEKHVSEYFSIFGRVSYEIKKLLENKDENLFDEPGSIIHKIEGCLLHVGITFNCPEIPRCKVKGCGIDYKHFHKGRTYRGLSNFQR